MYFPFLRGKQFELLALRELTPLMAEKKANISPIIEPVKISSTFDSTIDKLKKGDVNFNIIVNPSVGDLVRKSKEIVRAVTSDLVGYNNYQIGILVEQDTNYQNLLDLVSNINPKGFTFIHNEIVDYLDIELSRFTEIAPIENHIVNFNKTSRRYYRNFPVKTRVSLEDYFLSLDRNSDYLKHEDSQFSEEHKFYKEEGFKGFSDFLTIGEPYSDSGFAPFAVAIHISYSDDNNRIRIAHFVSDTNDDYSDTARKFAEANEKLVEWCDDEELDTKAINEFRHLHKTGHFPGLGTIKKLSIMHHIELVLNLQELY